MQNEQSFILPVKVLNSFDNISPFIDLYYVLNARFISYCLTTSLLGSLCSMFTYLLSLKRW